MTIKSTEKTKYAVDADGKYLGGFAGAPVPDGATEVAAPPENGRDTWDGAKWISVRDPNDYPLEPFQFYAMLEIIGKTGAVASAIASIPDATQRAVAQAKFQHMKEFERSDLLFTVLAPAVGLTDADIDAAWLLAKDFS